MSRVEQLLAQIGESQKDQARAIHQLLDNFKETARKMTGSGNAAGHSAFHLGDAVKAGAAGAIAGRAFGGGGSGGGGLANTGKTPFPSGSSLSEFYNRLTSDKYLQRQVYLDLKPIKREFNERMKSYRVEADNISRREMAYKDNGMWTYANRERIRSEVAKLAQDKKDARQNLHKKTLEVYRSSGMDDKWNESVKAYNQEIDEKNAQIRSKKRQTIYKSAFAGAVAGIASGIATVANGQSQISGNFEHAMSSMQQGMGQYSSFFNWTVRWGSSAIMPTISGIAKGVM